LWTSFEIRMLNGVTRGPQGSLLRDWTEITDWEYLQTLKKGDLDAFETRQ